MRAVCPRCLCVLKIGQDRSQPEGCGLWLYAVVD